MNLTEQQIERRREAGRKGGLARAKQFTRESQQAARQKVSRESLVRAGKAGAKTTIERHGMEKLFQKSRDYRIRNPSPTELVMIGILSFLNISFEREFRLEKSMFTVDFYISKTNLAVDVDGAIHDAGKPDFEKRVAARAVKKELLARLGMAYLVISHRQINDTSSTIRLIQEIVNTGEKK